MVLFGYSTLFSPVHLEFEYLLGTVTLLSLEAAAVDADHIL